MCVIFTEKGPADLIGRNDMKIDLAQVEKEYMTSNASIRELAKKFGIPTTTLQRHAKKNGWASKREDRIAKRAERMIAKEEGAQDDSWDRLRNTMRLVLEDEWNKCQEDVEYRLAVLPSLTRSTKYAREIGVFGPTASEKKTLKEVERMENESQDSEDKIVVEFENAEEYDE